MDGLLLVDKPKGWTSHDVVGKIRGILRESKATSLGKKLRVGHAGTLDPMATGLLIVLIGSATKRANQFLKLDKTYGAEVTLGKTSSTDDAEGDIQPISAKEPKRVEIEQTLNNFKGKIKQQPPRFSAIKIGGQRAYKLARKGAEVSLPLRAVTIYRLNLISYKYPKLKIEAEVSSGTYIRSLARDIGEELSTGAYLSGLRRTQVGGFYLHEASKITDINRKNLQKHLKPLL